MRVQRVLVLRAASWWSLLFVGLTIVFPIVQAGSHNLLTSHGHRGKQAVESMAHVDEMLSARLRESAFFCPELASTSADASGSSSSSSAAFATSSPSLRGGPENDAFCPDLSDSDEQEKEDEKDVLKCSMHSQRNCRLCRMFKDKWHTCKPNDMFLTFMKWIKDESIQKTDSQRMRGGQQVFLTLQKHCQDHECSSCLLEGLEKLEGYLDNIFMYKYKQALRITTQLSEYVNEMAPLDANDKVQALRDFTRPTINKVLKYVMMISPPWATQSKHRELFTNAISQMKQVIGKLVLIVHRYFEPIVKEGRLLSTASDPVKQKHVQTNNKKRSKRKDEKVLLQSRQTQWKADCDLLHAFTLDFIRLPFHFTLQSKLINPLGLIGGDACPPTSMRSWFESSEDT